MASQRSDLDRSCAFTCLLDLDPNFGRLELRAGSERVTVLLAAWYESDSTDMFAFCREWLAAEKTHTISADGRMQWLTLDEARAELVGIAEVLHALAPGESLVIRRHK